MRLKTTLRCLRRGATGATHEFAKEHLANHNHREGGREGGMVDGNVEIEVSCVFYKFSLILFCLFMDYVIIAFSLRQEH